VPLLPALPVQAEPTSPHVVWLTMAKFLLTLMAIGFVVLVAAFVFAAFHL
jgi:hypothetical protein